MSEKKKVGVVGRDVLLYQAAGFTVYPAETTAEAADMLRKAACECAVVFLTPAYAKELELEQYDTGLLPAVAALPEKGGGAGMAVLRRAPERAIGADILFREK